MLKRSFSAFTSDRRVDSDFPLPLCYSATLPGRSTVLLYIRVEFRDLLNLRRYQQDESQDTVGREVSSITQTSTFSRLRDELNRRSEGVDRLVEQQAGHLSPFERCHQRHNPPSRLKCSAFYKGVMAFVFLETSLECPTGSAIGRIHFFLLPC